MEGDYFANETFVDFDRKEMTPLSHCIASGNEAMFDLLLEFCAH